MTALARRFFFGLATLLAVGACQGKQRTMLVVEVDSNLAVPGELDKVDVAIAANGGVQHTPFSLIKDFTLPLYVGAVEMSGGTGNLTIVAAGYLGPSSIVNETAIVGFVEGKSMLLKLFLRANASTIRAPNPDLYHRRHLPRPRAHVV